MPDLSHLTAIGRRSLSAPAKYLLGQGLIVGSILDYGCGRGGDAKRLKADAYDPYYFPVEMYNKYDTILSTYVLNVILRSSDRDAVITTIKSLLHPGGNAYITVRRDVAGPVVTSKGTTQDRVILKLPSVKCTSSYEIYKLSN